MQKNKFILFQNMPKLKLQNWIWKQNIIDHCTFAQ